VVYDATTAAGLAARVRSLVGRDLAAWDAAARDVEVVLGDLREIVEHETIYPKPDVLAAIVAYYGVEASWLLTGEYDPIAHRRVEEDEIPAREVVDRLLREPGAPPP
jgi:hypothetical protein